MSNSNESAAARKPGEPVELSLKELLDRSQADFELEFFGDIAATAPAYVEVLLPLAQLLTEQGRHAEALEVDRRLAILKPDEPLVAYNLACSYSLLGRSREALDALRAAISLGYWDVDHLKLDPDLGNLHGLPEFETLLEALDFEFAED